MMQILEHFSLIFFSIVLLFSEIFVSSFTSLLISPAVKPRPPYIINATFFKKSGKASIYIGTQYQGDYLDGKLIFEMKITSAVGNMVRSFNRVALIIYNRSVFICSIIMKSFRKK